MSDDRKFPLLESALQYYIAGRFAFFAQLQPTGAILFHRAIEFLLKGGLANLDFDAGRIHDIENLWREFKDRIDRDFAPDLNLTVSDLNKFETLRYPEKSGGLLKKGMTGHYTFRRGGCGPQFFAGPPPPPYELYLEEIDELFGTIWLATGFNAKVFTSALKTEDARVHLTKHNKAAPFGNAD